MVLNSIVDDSLPSLALHLFRWEHYLFKIFCTVWNLMEKRIFLSQHSFNRYEHIEGNIFYNPDSLCRSENIHQVNYRNELDFLVSIEDLLDGPAR